MLKAFVLLKAYEHAAPFWASEFPLILRVELSPSPIVLGLHSPQHGGMGIPFPIATPRGRSLKFPRKGTSQVTYVTMVPWE